MDSLLCVTPLTILLIRSLGFSSLTFCSRLHRSLARLLLTTPVSYPLTALSLAHESTL